MSDEGLKPVVYIKGMKRYQHDYLRESMLLQAVGITQDPKKLKKMIGVSKVAEVYRTLDKLALRKEFHSALSRNGITMDYLVGNIRTLCDKAKQEKTKLGALNLLMKTLGLDKYDSDGEDKGKGWEELLIEAENKKGDEQEVNIHHVENEEVKQISEAKDVVSYDEFCEDYEVSAPETPDSIKKIKTKERKDADLLYGE